MFGFFDSYFLLFGLKISYYGFLIALAMALGVFVACKNARFRGLKSDNIIVVACYVLPLSIIGARAYYVIFSDQSYTFLQIFQIWKGGMAIYGGVIGGAIGVMLYCLIHKKNFLDIGDVVVPSLILGQAIGRIGCYFSKCCYGIEVTNEALQWFPFSTQIDGVWHLSTFFYESIWNFIVFAVLMIILRKAKLKHRGTVSALYLILYGLGRAIIEGFRGDSLMIGSLRTSQLLSIILIAVGLVIILVYFILAKKGFNRALVPEALPKEIKPEKKSKLTKERGILQTPNQEEKSSAEEISIEQDKEAKVKEKEIETDEIEKSRNENIKNQG